MSEVHFRVGKGYACGVQNRWGSQVITSTQHRTAVTCQNCLRTDTVQREPIRIPTVPGGPYRG